MTDSELRRKIEDMRLTHDGYSVGVMEPAMRKFLLGDTCRQRDIQIAFDAYEAGFEEANRWIPCSERLPENDKAMCLVLFDRSLTGIISLSSPNWTSLVTHWKEISLPEDLK